MQKERKDKNFVHKPVYPGGPAAMKQFVRENLKYPKEAFEKRIEGTVTLRYSIDHNGKVSDTHIVSGLGHGCDEEAVRIVSLFKFEVPKTRKMKVLFHKDIHIHFRLPKEQPMRPARHLQMQYQYITRAQTQSPKDAEKTNQGYQYTITINRNETG